MIAILSSVFEGEVDEQGWSKKPNVEEERFSVIGLSWNMGMGDVASKDFAFG